MNLGITILIICLLASGILFYNCHKYESHYKKLLWHRTKVKIKINRKMLGSIILRKYYDSIAASVALLGFVMCMYLTYSELFVTTQAFKTYYGYIIWIVLLIVAIIIIPVVIRMYKILNNTYYYLEDTIEHERSDTLRLSDEFFIHFKKCVVPTQVNAEIADALKAGDEVYLAVIKDKILVFNKNYFELEETDKLKEQYEIVGTIEGK